MYFQKLESLSNELDYKEFNKIIESLDKWLYLVPKSYKSTLMPELFSKEEDISFDISEMMFDKLVEIEVLKEKYYLRCSECGNVIVDSNDLNYILEKIKKYNKEREECIFCDRYKGLSIRNVFIMYELIDKPQIDITQKKTLSTEKLGGKTTQSNSLFNKFIKDPIGFFNKRNVNKKLFKDVCEENLSDEVKYLIEDE